MLDADPKAIQQIDFTGNLDQPGSTTIFSITEEAKETLFDFFKRSSENIVNLFCFNMI